MAAILKFFKPHLLPNSKSDDQKLDGRHEGDMKIQIAESFSSNIQDGGHGGSLETLQTSDSELLKAIRSDSQDGHHGTM